MRNLYDVLGVGKDADQATIRKAFKKLARTYHPDLNKEDPKAPDLFKEVNAAYEVLGDEERRSLYDEFGEVSLKAGFDAQKARQWKSMGGGMGGGPGGGFPGGFGGGGVNVDDILGSFFGRGGGRARRTRQGPRRGPDIEAELSVSVPDMVQRKAQAVSVRRPAACQDCSGMGGTGRQTCPQCQGSGSVLLGRGMMMPCSQCGGDGVVYEEECQTCGSTGRTMQTERLRIKIPPGSGDGRTIRLRGKGGAGVRGGPAGDLMLTLRVAPHPILKISGDDLELDLPLTIAEAVVGGPVEVPLPDGGTVKVKVPAGTRTGQRLRLRGKGLPVSAEASGDLYLVLRPTPPQAEDPEVARLAQELDAFYEADVRADLVM